jgi:hypothetical protein
MGTQREELELERLRHENQLLQAKTEAMNKTDRIETLMNEALTAFRTYSGHGEEVDYED